MSQTTAQVPSLYNRDFGNSRLHAIVHIWLENLQLRSVDDLPSHIHLVPRNPFPLVSTSLAHRNFGSKAEGEGSSSWRENPSLMSRAEAPSSSFEQSEKNRVHRSARVRVTLSMLIWKSLGAEWPSRNLKSRYSRPLLSQPASADTVLPDILDPPLPHVNVCEAGDRISSRRNFSNRVLLSTNDCIMTYAEVTVSDTQDHDVGAYVLVSLQGIFDMIFEV